MINESIGTNQEIHAKNVISVCIEMDIRNLDMHINNVMETIINAGYTIASNFFYCINSDLTDSENMIVQLFVPVNEEYDKNKLDWTTYNYNSYFQITGMAGFRTRGTNKDVQDKVNELRYLLLDEKIDPLTPLFFIPNKVKNKLYIDIMTKIS